MKTGVCVCVCVHVCVCDVQVGKMDLWTESTVHWIYQNVQIKWKVYDFWKEHLRFDQILIAVQLIVMLQEAVD